MTRRADIQPGEIPRLLPLLSLLDVEVDPRRYRVRLAGTRLYDFYGREITGVYVDELDWGPKSDYWAAAYRRVVERARPTQGIVRAPHESRDHLVQFWIRLPLSDDGEQVSMILSYDSFVPVSTALHLAELPAQGGSIRLDT